jgi:DNA-binding Lrp family transcriptional regulator
MKKEHKKCAEKGKIKLDETDIQIVEELNKNGRAPLLVESINL